MFVSINSLGSMVLDINGDRLDAVFLDDVGNILDNFTMLIEGVSPVDTVAPDSPPNARSTTVTASSITLAWDAATDNVGVTGYEVSRDGQIVDTVDALSFTDTSLAASTTYVYGIGAIDAAGNKSSVATVSATTAAAPVNAVPSGGGGYTGPIFLITLLLTVGIRRQHDA